MYDDTVTDFERESSKKLLTLESDNLLREIERLDKQREIQSDRLQNAMELVRRHSPGVNFANGMWPGALIRPH